MTIEFTLEECNALYDVIDVLSGCNPETVFAWDGSDNLDDITTAAAVKLFKATSHKVPDSVK